MAILDQFAVLAAEVAPFLQLVAADTLGFVAVLANRNMATQAARL